MLNLTAALLLLLTPAPPLTVGGQIKGPLPADARVLLVAVAPDAEAGRLELEGKAGPEPAATGTVTADGSFHLQAPETGLWKVVIQAPGFVPQEYLLVPLVESIDLPAVRLEKDQRTEVRVTGADGRPVAGARVRVVNPESQYNWRTPVRSGLTDAQGALVLPRGAKEGLLVRAGAPGLPFAERRDVRSSAVALRLEAGRSRDVRVVDAAGKPVAGALVRIGEPLWTVGATSEDGLLSIPLAGRDKVKLSVLAGARSLAGYVEPARETEKGPKELRLPATQTLAGRIVSAADGRPVAGALVWSDDLGSFQRAGADGAYRFEAVPGRQLALMGAAPGFFQQETDWTVQTQDRRAPTLALEPALALSGTVVDEQGRPVAGAEIKARLQPGSRPRTMAGWGSGGNALTSPAGVFRISTLYAGLAHELTLTRRGFAVSRETVPPLEPGRPAVPVRLVLRPGRTGAGRVVNQADQPVAGATVLLEPVASGDLMARMNRGRDDAWRFEATAGADGRFEVPDLPPGTFELTARGPGYAPITVPGLTVPEGAGRIDLGTISLVRGVALEGFVTGPGGKPVEGARIALSTASADPMAAFGGSDGPPSAITGQDGFFRVEDRRAGETVDVDVRRAGYARGSAPGVRVPAEEPLRIVLRPTSALEGRTVDPDGKPVAGARLFLNPTGPTAMGQGFVLFSDADMKEAFSGQDGVFRIEDVPAGTFGLKAEAAGRQSVDRSGLEVVSGQDLKGVEVVLPAGAVIEGRVLASGRPVPGAEVQLVEPESSVTRFIIRSPSGRADGDGYYRIDGVTPGARTFQAEAKGFRKTVRELEAREGGNALDFALEAGAQVTGRVVDDAGSPVSAALVTLREGVNSWNLPNGVSGPDGGFTLSGVGDGTYRISARKEGFVSGEGQELTVAGSSVSGVEVTLATGGAIVGQLTGLDFTELSQVSVWADDEFHTGRVSPDGTYRIEQVEPGERRVVASVRGARQTEGRVTLEAGEREARLDLEFKDGHLLTGQVLRNGEPARGEAVSLSGPGVAGRWSEIDHEGRFRYEGLDSGAYELEVMDRRGQTSHKESVELFGDRDLRIELQTAPIAGRILDSLDKGPVAGVQVLLLQPEGQKSQSFMKLEAVTDSRGDFRLPDVPEGDWRVRAVLAGYAPGEVAVHLDAGSPPDDLEIVLQATEGVTLEVVLPSGRPPDTIRTAVLDASGRVTATTTYPVGENGRVRVSSVAPGNWELLLDADGSAPVSLPVTSPGNAGRVALPLPGSLDLKVPALAGTRIGAKVRLTDANGKLFRNAWGDAPATFDLDVGAYKFDRLAPGAWKVDVTADDGRTWTGTATVVPGGTAPLVLEQRLE
ncbi:MAG: carboxypeptidase regulatory-like domain-containing protein [Acidobacteriota bacterium]